jgi:hypothetical protein
VQLRVEAGAAESHGLLQLRGSTETAVASPMFEGLAEVYAAEEQQPAPAPKWRWLWRC